MHYTSPQDQNQPQPPVPISITICGDGGCGKSSITLRLVRSQWTSEYDPTIEDSYSITRRIDGTTYHLSLTDTAGQEEYRGMWASSNLGADAFLLVYDITSQSSLDQLDYFNELIDMESETRLDNAQRAQRAGLSPHSSRNNSSAPIHNPGAGSGGRTIPPVKLVAGNKCDLSEGREVAASHGLDWARKRGCGFMETSARLEVNIEETFALLVRRVAEARRLAAQGILDTAEMDRRGTTKPLTPIGSGVDGDGEKGGSDVEGLRRLRGPRLFGDGGRFSGGGGDVVIKGLDCSNSGFGYGYREDPTPYLKGLQSQIANQEEGWELMSSKSCLEEYSLCNPRTIHGDVVMVVNVNTSSSSSDDGSSPDGWKPRDVYPDLPLISINSWDPPLRPYEVNPLWYSARCVVYRSQSIHSFDVCENRCGAVLGNNGQVMIDISSQTNPSINSSSLPVLDFSDPYYKSPLTKSFDSLDVKYCWSRARGKLCQVRMSNTLILAVMICFFVKAIQSWVVVKRLPNLSLVTPGDALHSFITKPDPLTFGMCTMELKDSLRLEEGPRHYLSAVDVDIHGLQPNLTSRKFKPRKHRLYSSFPRIVWVRTYGVLSIGGAILLAGLVLSVTQRAPKGASNIDASRFGPGSNAYTALPLETDFLGSMIFANSPQLLLSLCYFVYNAFITRLMTEKEWNSYYYDAKPLRVSYPMGNQVSTYRLQLPYKWSLPMILLSALLHWLLSNVMFLFVSDGGYWSDHGFQTYDGTQIRVFGVGYSGFGVILLFCIIFPLLALPLIFSLRLTKSGMVAGGSDSRVISAACHCHAAILDTATMKKEKGGIEEAKASSLTSVDADPQTTPGAGAERNLSSNVVADGDNPTEDTTVSADPNDDDCRGTNNGDDNEETHFLEEEEKYKRLRDLSLSKVRWGAMKPTAELLRRVTPREGERLMHLGFGGVGTEMHEPREDEYYA